MNRTGALLALALLTGVLFLTPALADGSLLAGIQDAPPASLDVDIEVADPEGNRWAVSPVWLAIGGLAVLFLIVLVVVAARGHSGGTTVVHE